jgi:regulator of protease activity HflC (stomatin/prohibitin superfamily)
MDFIGLPIALFVVAVLLFGTFFTVPQRHEALVTRFGKFVRRNHAGLNFKIPVIEKVAAYQSTALRQIEDKIEIKTSDDILPVIPVTVYYTVVDTEKYVFDIGGNQETHILNRVNAAIRKITSKLDSQDLYSKREEINDVVKRDIEEEMVQYGIVVSDVIVDEPRLPEEIKTAYNSVRAADRNLMAARKDAEASKVQIVKEAEARKEAAALYGQGVAEQRAAIIGELKNQIALLCEGKNGITAEAAVAIVSLASEQDTMREIGDQGNLIIASGSTNDFVARLGALQEQMRKHDKDDAA